MLAMDILLLGYFLKFKKWVILEGKWKPAHFVSK